MRPHGRTGARTHEALMALRAVALVAALALAATPAFAQEATAPATPLRLRFQVGAGASYLEHRVFAGNGLELSSGTLFGGQAVVSIGSHVEVGGGGVGGALTADSASADDATMARASGYIAVLPVPWLAVRAGGTIHTFSTDFAVQRWSSLRLGGEGRMHFTGGRLTGIVRLELYPLMSVSGLAKPSRGFGAASGLVFRSGSVTGSALYEFERYDFPASGGVQRREQLGALTVSLGLALGR